jgi:hypothetical protein
LNCELVGLLSFFGRDQRPLLARLQDLRKACALLARGELLG